MYICLHQHPHVSYVLSTRDNLTITFLLLSSTDYVGSHDIVLVNE